MILLVLLGAIIGALFAAGGEASLKQVVSLLSGGHLIDSLPSFSKMHPTYS